jgi:replicative DNA helicase
MKEYINIIVYLLNNNLYNKYINYIDIKNENKELVFLYNCLKELHTLYKKDLSLDEYVLYCLSNVNDKDRQVVESLLSTLQGSTIDDQFVGDILTTLRNKKLAYELALVSLDVSEGRSSVDKIFNTIDTFEQQKIVEQVDFVSGNLNELYNDAIKTTGLRWRLATLNRMLGSLRKGDFGFIFARPETGKTTFLASEITFFAGQLSEEMGPILWFNNEEQGSKVMLRCIQASLGLTQAELFSNINHHQSTFDTNGGQFIKIFDSANIHRRQVEQLCKELNPSLVVFDQIDKIKGFTDDREDLRLGAIYIWSRELAKTYCPVIGVCQADASGEGKRWLTMENVANAKTAKQAEADWILGVGKTHDTALEYVRHFHLSKNKLAGDADTEPEMRHGKADVLIKPLIARYCDLDIE